MEFLKTNIIIYRNMKCIRIVDGTSFYSTPIFRVSTNTKLSSNATAIQRLHRVSLVPCINWKPV